MLTDAQADELRDVPCFDVMPGWVTLNGYVIVKGDVPYGLRIGPKPHLTKKAEELLSRASEAAKDWQQLTLDPPETTEPADAWQEIHVLGTADTNGDVLGMGAPLAALVEQLHPDGEWRMGRDEGSPYRIGKNEKMVVRVVDGEVVALVAPVIREPVETAHTGG